MCKEGTLPQHSREEKHNRPVRLSIGFVYIAADRDQKLAGLERAKQLVLDFGGKLIGEHVSEQQGKTDPITSIELVVEIPYHVTQLHHSFDSVLNNADTGCDAGWVTMIS